ncbi:hypothetical protein N9597_00090 [Candidatus Marinimicrobia bacterium]|nr:hypothetical protein [Candidatus Neomarinimicrobiota bacterium]
MTYFSQIYPSNLLGIFHSVPLFLLIVYLVFSYRKYNPNYIGIDTKIWVSYGMQRYANITKGD